MNKTVFLDPGHGGNDPGATSGNRYESNDNLKLSLAVHKLLTAQGLTVVMARTTDVAVSLSARTATANKAGAALFVSLHRNSAQKYVNGKAQWNPDGSPVLDTTAQGVEIWVYTTAGAVDVGAATDVMEQLVAVGVQSNRGIKKGDYHVLRESTMPSMLIELGFISNTKDNTLYDQNFDAYARAIAVGICSALGVSYTEGGTETSATPKYKVQVGAFGVESNARAFLQEVQKKRAARFPGYPGRGNKGKLILSDSDT